ncbi:16S ribosomal RNA methyltransferase RsmE [Listeria grayi FSL F6-1183]|uniref:Ribosomal RNA small subunit methyltransferase E n=1 Tax=Listeria grayi FSL F6-1183 TaxID=1265827 RepID=A0A829R8J6_LISGR|nr:16S ribosomal RNA methyltransferase RsmE [Listeria grayi FSL F6-1183]
MQRYFVDQVLTTDDDPIYIEAADHHHLARVMRMTTGDQVYIVFADNQFCTAEIVSVSEDKTLLKLVEWQTNNPELPIAITIASGLPKGDKLEWIVQKGTELGADSFIAFPSDRSIVKWDAKKTEKKTRTSTKNRERSSRTIASRPRTNDHYPCKWETTC